MIDPSLAIFGLSLGVSITMFAWLHLRKVDAVMCMLVGSGLEKETAVLQFSIANLGTCPALINGVGVTIYMKPELNGKFMCDHETFKDPLPQVIKPGEILSVTVRSKWNITFLCEAAKEAKGRGEQTASMFFVAVISAWNPKGKQMSGSEQVSTLVTDYNHSLSCFEPCKSIFKLRKRKKTDVLIGSKV